MFCADYISSFLFHGLITGAGVAAGRTGHEADFNKPGTQILVGALAGLLGAAAVFPFDFVRRGVLSRATFRHSLSTVPYAATYFGVYFSCRDPASISSQVGWAVTASVSAAAAEIPFDTTKRVLLGSRRNMLLVSSLYAPFGALMLIMYDKAVEKYKMFRIAS